VGIGLIYFNDAVLPDPGQLETSVDGGVTWLNMPSGNIYYVTAEKDGVSYETVKFNVDTADAVDPQRVVLVAPY
jgi:hypothetical protein